MRRECDPVPSVRPDAAGDDDASDAPDHAFGGRPILLSDIDRMLEDSAELDRLDHDGLRTWRADLILVLESLTYARTVLAADVAILRTAGAPDAQTRSAWSTASPACSAPARRGIPHPAPGDERAAPEPDDGLFLRTEQLLAAHGEMAQVELSSAFDVAGSLAVIEEQLTALSERQEAVEGRLQQIRAAVIRRYEEGAAPARDQPA